MTIRQRISASLGPIAVSLLAAIVLFLAIRGGADDAEDPATPQRQHPPHGTRFWFEVIESFNAKYEGDSPGHIGRGGGLTLHPRVALGDSVYHRIGDADQAIGIVTGATWDRLKGSLNVEFRPRNDHRIAVGDEVWIDVNPAPRAPEALGAGAPSKASTSERHAR